MLHHHPCPWASGNAEPASARGELKLPPARERAASAGASLNAAVVLPGSCPAELLPPERGFSHWAWE